jgi:hypothetical protein
VISTMALSCSSSLRSSSLPAKMSIRVLLTGSLSSVSVIVYSSGPSHLA